MSGGSEVFSGVGANPGNEDIAGIRTQIYTYLEDCEEWVSDAIAQVKAQLDALESGDPVVQVSLLSYPTFVTPSLANPGLLTPIYEVLMWLLHWGNILFPIIAFFIQEFIRQLINGGATNAQMRLFKKFAFLDEDSSDQGFPKLTSLLLLLLDRPIEILNSMGYTDVYLDNRMKIEEEEEP